MMRSGGVVYPNAHERNVTTKIDVRKASGFSRRISTTAGDEANYQATRSDSRLVPSRTIVAASGLDQSRIAQGR
jgi:hypothetical protein